jgi:hypothetical protein
MLMEDAKADEVAMLSKIDLLDGFWQMLVANDQGHPIHIVVPSVLQMDLLLCGHIAISFKVSLPIGCPHCFEEYMHPSTVAKCSKLNSPAHGIYIYVDNFIRAAIKNKSGNLL